MKAEKVRRLEKAGWRLGDAKEFLNLDASEAEFVEIKLALAGRLRELREHHRWTQADLAGMLLKPIQSGENGGSRSNSHRRFTRSIPPRGGR
jgi:hypothetical protein